MPTHDNLGIRMKTFYEQTPKTKLMRRCPVVIRIDGKAFHTFTRKFQKPFDEVLINSMQETMKYLCENIQGCVFGYTQSDEITLILVDYKKFTSSAWFDYEVQKICSISASMATMAFNKFFRDNADLNGHVDAWFDEDILHNWINGEFTKCVLQAKNKNQLLKAKTMAEELGMIEGKDFWLIKDNCRTELEPEEDGRTLTVIGFKPMNSELIDKIGRKYHLYI